MRLLLVSALLLSVCSFAGGSMAVGSAVAAECSGENCPPPASQGQGRDCERKKQEQTVS